MLDPGRAAATAAARRLAGAHGPGVVIAVGGGKGGTGKTFVTASVGTELARRGLRVVLVDCDLGGANLHSFLGIDYPRATLSDFILRRVGDLAALQVATPVDNLKLISGARNAVQVSNPMYQQKQRLLRAIGALPADAVMLDLGAGSHFNIVDFFLLARCGVVVVMPEPTAVENAYRFVKATFLRRLRNLELDDSLKKMIQDVVRSPRERPLAPADLAAIVEGADPEAGERLRRDMEGFRPLLLVNQVRRREDLDLGEAMCAAARRFFGVGMDYLGHVGYHERVWQAVRQRRPMLGERLGAAFSGDLQRIVDALLDVVQNGHEVVP